MDSIQLKLCDIQGRLFERSLQLECSSEAFIKAFMNSDVAKNLDSVYNRMQWAGEEYLLEELTAQKAIEPSAIGKKYEKDVLFWIGYLYRYWHFMTKETSKEIYKQASAKTMEVNYLMFHSMDPEIAIEDLKEIYRQKNE